MLLNMLKEYLWKEWRYNTIPKYYHLFDEWYKNLTETQIKYYTAYAEGVKTPYIKK